MSSTRGQALRAIPQLCQVALGLAFLVVAGLGGLAWRLAQSPIALPFLAETIERQVNARPDGTRLAIGRAAIAWEGFHGGTAAPLDLRFTDVRLRNADGAIEAELPDATATLSARALLRGTIAPATIDLYRPRLTATLSPAGGLTLALGSAAPAQAGGAPGPDASLGMLAELMYPASDAEGATALRRLRIHGGEATLIDPRSGRRWTLLEPQLDLRRAAGGGLAGEGQAVFRSGGLGVPVRLTGRAEGGGEGTGPMRLSAGISLPVLRPSEIATLWPPLAPLALVDAPLALTATAEFDALGTPLRVAAGLVGGAGTLDLGGGRRVPIHRLQAAADLDGRTLTLREGRLVLPGRAGGAGPGFAVTGSARQAEADGAAAWDAALTLRADPLSAADLPQLWPATLAPAARATLLGGLPAGQLTDFLLAVRLRIPEAMDDLAWRQARLALGATGAVFQLAPGQRLATERLDLVLEATPEAVQLEQLALRLPSHHGPGPLILASGAAARAGGQWRGWLAPSLDHLSLAELPNHWPPGIGVNARRWLAENVTAGEARDGQWRIDATLPEADPAALRILGLTGTLGISDATVHWLRPVPPAQGIGGVVSFGLKEITIRTRGGRQPATQGARTGLDLRDGTLRFLNLETEPGNLDLAVQVAGPLADTVALLRHPRLKLFERRPLKLEVAGGQAEAQLAVTFPLWADLPAEDLRIRASARVTEARLPGALLGQALDRAAVELAVTQDSLRATGQGLLAGAPVRLGVEMDFRSGPPTQVTERATLTGRLDGAQLAALGLDAGRLLSGPVAIEARAEKRRNGAGTVAVRGDLTEARLGLDAISWAKLAGTPGVAEASVRLQGDALASIESFRLEALELALRGRASFGRQSRLERVEITESLFGGSRFTGDLRRPEREGGPWQAVLRGPLLDLRPLMGPPGHAEGGALREPAPPEADGPPVQLDLRFDRVTMGEGRNLAGLIARARTDARGLLREARANGTTLGPGQPAPFELTLTPRGDRRQLRLTAEDGGALLHALDLVNAIQGGRLTVNASYAELLPGAPLAGEAQLDGFTLRDAPAAAKLLQALTIYGVMEAAQGGTGLRVTRLVAPFSLTPEALTLRDARAFSTSLGITAKGRILRERAIAEIEGTIVPSYALNTMLGNLPLVGRLFSPEQGGGVFAATYRVVGPLADPQVTVNPLAALTPGFLRGIFGSLADDRPGGAPPPPEPSPQGR